MRRLLQVQHRTTCPAASAQAAKAICNAHNNIGRRSALYYGLSLTIFQELVPLARPSSSALLSAVSGAQQTHWIQTQHCWTLESALLYNLLHNLVWLELPLLPSGASPVYKCDKRRPISLCLSPLFPPSPFCCMLPVRLFYTMVTHQCKATGGDVCPDSNSGLVGAVPSPQGSLSGRRAGKTLCCVSLVEVQPTGSPLKAPVQGSDHSKHTEGLRCVAEGHKKADKHVVGAGASSVIAVYK